MDSTKRTLEGPTPSGPPLKRQNDSGGAEEELVDEQFDTVPENLEDDGEDVDERLLEEDLELHIGEAGRNWKRPAPPPLNPASESLGVLSIAGFSHTALVEVCLLLLCPQLGQIFTQA